MAKEVIRILNSLNCQLEPGSPYRSSPPRGIIVSSTTEAGNPRSPGSTRAPTQAGRGTGRGSRRSQALVAQLMSRNETCRIVLYQDRRAHIGVAGLTWWHPWLTEIDNLSKKGREMCPSRRPVDIAEFEFLDPKSKFERHWKKRFSNFENQFPGPKITNRNRIAGFEVQIFEFWG